VASRPLATKPMMGCRRNYINEDGGSSQILHPQKDHK